MNKGRLFFGARYGSRTRLIWLGTRGTTDVLTLQKVYIQSIIKYERCQTKVVDKIWGARCNLNCGISR